MNLALNQIALASVGANASYLGVNPTEKEGGKCVKYPSHFLSNGIYFA